MIDLEGIEAVLKDYGYLRDGDCNALIAELKASLEENQRLREALEKACIGAKALYSFLDEIDTAGDIFKPEITPYFEAVQVYHKKRHLIATTDGYSINFPPEQALKEE